jgi:hypothetical protein
MINKANHLLRPHLSDRFSLPIHPFLLTVFISELTCRAWLIAETNKRRTLQKADVANAIAHSDMFDFLIDIIPRDDGSPPAATNAATTGTTSGSAVIPPAGKVEVVLEEDEDDDEDDEDERVFTEFVRQEDDG